MKRVFLFLVCYLLAMIGFAQGNSGLGFNYQAVVRGVDGFVLPKQSVELRFSLMPGQSATEASWVETHNVVTDAVGTIGVTVGKGTKAGGIAATYADVNFGAIHYWLKVEIREGGNYRELSYTALASVPYAEVATIGRNTGIPPGTVVAFAAPRNKAGTNQSIIPEGWLLCDGRAISRSEYADLYDAIGTAWGHGNNSTTFNIPDMQGYFLRGMDYSNYDRERNPDRSSRTPLKEGGNSGSNVGSYQNDAIRNITGSFMIDGTEYGNEATGSFFFDGIGGNFGRGHDKSATNPRVRFDASKSGVPTGGENRPKNVCVNYIIKY